MSLCSHGAHMASHSVQCSVRVLTQLHTKCRHLCPVMSCLSRPPSQWRSCLSTSNVPQPSVLPSETCKTSMSSYWTEFQLPRPFRSTSECLRDDSILWTPVYVWGIDVIHNCKLPGSLCAYIQLFFCRDHIIISINLSPIIDDFECIMCKAHYRTHTYTRQHYANELI